LMTMTTTKTTKVTVRHMMLIKFVSYFVLLMRRLVTGSDRYRTVEANYRQTQSIT